MSLPPWLHLDQYCSGSSRTWRFTCSRCRAVVDLPPAHDGCLPEDKLSVLTDAHRTCKDIPGKGPSAPTNA